MEYSVQYNFWNSVPLLEAEILMDIHENSHFKLFNNNTWNFQNISNLLNFKFTLGCFYKGSKPYPSSSQNLNFPRRDATRKSYETFFYLLPLPGVE
jgi:hypothetical protein